MLLTLEWRSDKKKRMPEGPLHLDEKNKHKLVSFPAGWCIVSYSQHCGFINYDSWIGVLSIKNAEI